MGGRQRAMHQALRTLVESFRRWRGGTLSAAAARVAGCAATWAVLAAATGAQQSVVDTVHNLSVSGPGPVRSTVEQEVCVFCHTPHNGRTEAPLWNRRDSTAAYLPYNSPTLRAAPGQPTGASKLCLSCHDGTIALGDLVSRAAPVPMAGSPTMPAGRGLIGTDLRDDHPISFPYAQSYASAGDRLRAPGQWDPRVKLDPAGQLQCTTCHDPHDNSFGAFLVMDNASATLCTQCHNYPFFATTAHAQSILRWNGAGLDPWPHTDYPDVRTNACMNCHMSHHAGGPQELLVRERMDELCLACHNGNVARYDMQAVFDKPSRHPVATAGTGHRAGESPLEAAGHVTCADCHNPHRARRAPAVPPFVKGANRGVSGIDLNGAPVPEASFEYQICFKCHATGATASLGAVPRQVPSADLRRAMHPDAPSYHPVTTAGRNPDVPSLIAPFSETSLIFCTDCHNHDAAQGGVVGSNGPHGSIYPFLLARQYRTGDRVSESPAAYALCYGCHDRASILGDESFPFHRLHVQEQQTPCSVCHDPHGIDMAAGDPVRHARLINFDISVVRPDPTTGLIEFRSLGPRMGECTLLCHGVGHQSTRYPER